MTRWFLVFLGLLVSQSRAYGSEANDLRIAIRKSITSTADVDAKYQVAEGRLQEGTFAKVFVAVERRKAEDQEDQDPAAKKPATEYFAVRQLSKLFHRSETHSLQNIKDDIDSHLMLLKRADFKHPNFVRIVDIVMWQGFPTIIQSLARGEDLYTVLYGEDGKDRTELDLSPCGSHRQTAVKGGQMAER